MTRPTLRLLESNTFARREEPSDSLSETEIIGNMFDGDLGNDLPDGAWLFYLPPLRKVRRVVRNFILTIGLVVTLPFLAGCGGQSGGKREPVFPVSGKVTYKGQAVTEADVTFFCKEKNMSSFAKTDSEGKFRMTTFASFDGAPAGKHLITISKSERASSTTKEVDVTDPAYDPLKLVEDAKAPPPKNLIPGKYADAKSTDLFATVTADGQTPDVVLDLKD